jgi:hypothetical protein
MTGSQNRVQTGKSPVAPGILLPVVHWGFRDLHISSVKHQIPRLMTYNLPHISIEARFQDIIIGGGILDPRSSVSGDWLICGEMEDIVHNVQNVWYLYSSISVRSMILRQLPQFFRSIQHHNSRVCSRASP